MFGQVATEMNKCFVVVATKRNKRSVVVLLLKGGKGDIEIF